MNSFIYVINIIIIINYSSILIQNNYYQLSVNTCSKITI